MVALMNKEPLWEMLEEKQICDQLFHMSGHHSVCQKMKPSSVLELAAVLSIIIPAKRHLIGKSWDEVFETVWEKPEDGSYYFKRGAFGSLCIGGSS